MPVRRSSDAVLLNLVRESDESLSAVARQLGSSSSGLQEVGQAEIDQGRATGLSTEERKELTKLQRENRVLRMVLHPQHDQPRQL